MYKYVDCTYTNLSLWKASENLPTFIIYIYIVQGFRMVIWYLDNKRIITTKINFKGVPKVKYVKLNILPNMYMGAWQMHVILGQGRARGFNSGNNHKLN